MIASMQTRYSATRVSGDAFGKRQSADALLKQAEEEAERILLIASKEADEITADARNEADQLLTAAKTGVEDEIAAYVSDEKQQRLAETLLELAETTDVLKGEFEALEVWVTELIMTAVRNIIGDLTEDDRVSAIIRTGLNDTRRRWAIEIHTSPDELAYVRDLFEQRKDSLVGVDAVVANSDLAPGELELSGPNSICSIGLNVQLQALEKVLKQNLSAA